MALTPKNASDSLIEALSEIATVPELFFHTTKRHRPDIYECRKCGHKFPQEAACPECGSGDMFLFMRAPARSEVRSGDREEQLTDLDPDWRERFGGDEERAWDFYKSPPRRTRVVYSSGPREEPDETKDLPEVDHGDERDFDTDLEPHDER